MNKLFFIFSILMFSITATAQNWITDIDEAKEIAVKENKTIILVFQGSDWCAPCIKLDKEIWNTETFKNYAKDHYAMVKVDFPRNKKNALSKQQQLKNNKLAETYNTNGYFPFVVVLDNKGNSIGETGYLKTTPNKYIKQLNSFSD